MQSLHGKGKQKTKYTWSAQSFCYICPYSLHSLTQHSPKRQQHHNIQQLLYLLHRVVDIHPRLAYVFRLTSRGRFEATTWRRSIDYTPHSKPIHKTRTLVVRIYAYKLTRFAPITFFVQSTLHTYTFSHLITHFPFFFLVRLISAYRLKARVVLCGNVCSLSRTLRVVIV